MFVLRSSLVLVLTLTTEMLILWQCAQIARDGLEDINYNFSFFIVFSMLCTSHAMRMKMTSRQSLISVRWSHVRNMSNWPTTASLMGAIMISTTWPALTTPPVASCSLPMGCPYSVNTGLACLRILLSCLWSRDVALQIRGWTFWLRTRK